LKLGGYLLRTGLAVAQGPHVGGGGVEVVDLQALPVVEA
jgi:hypothetical protein